MVSKTFDEGSNPSRPANNIDMMIQYKHKQKR